MDWLVVLPLKPTARAKTRLGLSAEQRTAMARAFAADLIAAVTAAGVRAIRVVAGPDDRSVLPRHVTWVADPGLGLNPAIAAAASAAEPEQPVLVLMGDLPCVTDADVRSLLESIDTGLRTGATSLFVADQAGTGSTALAARHQQLDPKFGPRSRAKHRAAGSVELTDAGLVRLRRDVDSLVDLADAVRLGVGPHTRAVAASLALC